MHDWGYVFTWPPVIDQLTPREQQLIMLAERTETYIQQEVRHQPQGRPSNFGSVTESRRDAFQ